MVFACAKAWCRAFTKYAGVATSPGPKEHAQASGNSGPEMQALTQLLRVQVNAA